MKLEIDLMKPDEVAAGIEFLQISQARRVPSLTAPIDADRLKTIAIAAMSAESKRLDPIVNIADFTQRTQVPDGEEFYNAETLMGTEGLSPAAVFGGTPVADPLPSSTIAPPPPVSIVPTTPIPGPASSVAAVELDVKGLPWDSRIHSSSKNKLANGCWKVARGKAPEYVAQVESELRGTPTNGGLAVPIPPAPPAPLPHAVVVPPPAPNADPVSFETLMTRISPQISAGVLPPQAVMEACKANGLQSVVGLQSSPQLVPLVWATLKATYPALV